MDVLFEVAWRGGILLGMIWASFPVWYVINHLGGVAGRWLSLSRVIFVLWLGLLTWGCYSLLEYGPDQVWEGAAKLFVSFWLALLISMVTNPNLVGPRPGPTNLSREEE